MLGLSPHGVVADPIAMVVSDRQGRVKAKSITDFATIFAAKIGYQREKCRFLLPGTCEPRLTLLSERT
jgi:hypothetical protein